MESYDDNGELISDVEKVSDEVQTLGYSPGGERIVAAETGGEKSPAVMITAGAHSTEHAGVVAAVELLEKLDTDHEVYVIPTRDPIGLNGFEYALELALDRNMAVDAYSRARSILEMEGEVVYDDGSLCIALIGDYGFAIKPLDDGGGVTILQQLKELTQTNPEILTELAGRRIFTSAGYTDVEAADPFERTYTLIISPDGRPLHLNRFFIDTWAPVETRCVRQLMAEVEPGLMFDNHETSGQDDRYYIQLHPQRTAEGDARAKQIADAATTAVKDIGVELATDEDVLQGPTRTVANTGEDAQPDDGFYSRATGGGYWFDPNLTSPPRMGEGLNAADYAAEHYGLAFTLETGMYGPLEERVEAAVLSVQTAVREFEDNY